MHEKHKIANLEVLLDYYKKYDESFSDHIILNTIIKIYKFKKDLSYKIIRYENFMKEKNILVENYVYNSNYHEKG